MGLAIPQVNDFYLIPRPLRAEGKDEILKRADRHTCKVDDTITGLEARFLSWAFGSHAHQFHPKSRRLGEIGDGPKVGAITTPALPDPRRLPLRLGIGERIGPL